MTGAALAGLALSLVLFAIELIVGVVRPIETFGGAVFAVLFFGSTSLAIAMQKHHQTILRAVMTSYVVKTLLIVVTLWFVSFDEAHKIITGASITASSFAYLIVQTMYFAGRKGRMQRRISRFS